MIKKGTLTVQSRVVDAIIKDQDGKWIVHGYSKLQFGFIHPWEIGPLSDVVSVAKTILEIEHDNEKLKGA